MGEALELEVRAGQWEHSAELDDFNQSYVTSDGLTAKAELGTLEVLAARLAGRPAWSEHETFAVRLGEETEMELRWMGVAELRVIDAETGTELSAVDLAPDEFDLPPVNAEQLEDELVVRGQPSPISFAPELEDFALETRRNWLVGAAGYAWQVVAIDHGRGGKRTVELERAGELRVQLTGETPGMTQLELTPNFECGLQGRSPELWPTGPAGSKHASAERLAPGSWSVALKSGMDYNRRATLVEVEVVIEAGRTTQVELAVPVIPAQGEAVPLGGELHVAQQWQNLGRLLFSIRPEDPSPYDHRVYRSSGHSTVSLGSSVSHLAKVDGDPERRRWHGGWRAPGNYSAELSLSGTGCIWQESFTVSQGGSENILLHLPPPTKLSVIPRDMETGERLLHGSQSLAEAGISISYLVPAAHSVFVELPGELDGARGVFEGWVAPCELMISVQSETHGWETETLVAQGPAQEMIIDMQAMKMLSLRLESGGEPVIVPQEWWWEVALMDREGEDLDFGMDSGLELPGSTNFLVGGIDHCRVSFPELNGYETLGQLEVTLEEAGTTVRTIQLFSK